MRPASIFKITASVILIATISCRELEASYNLPPGGHQLLLQGFTDGTLGGFTTISLDGDRQWEAANWNEIEYFVEINGNAADSGNDDWLISPPLDFEHTIKEGLTFDTMSSFNGPPLELLISTDYDGESDPTTATWDVLSANFSESDWKLVSSGRVDVSMYDGESVYIAWHYTSENGANARAIQVTNVAVSGHPFIIGDDFLDGDLGDFRSINLEGESMWFAGNYKERFYYAMIENGQSTSPNDAWLITPEIDLSVTADETFFFTSLTETENDDLTVLMSTNYDGGDDPSTATWELVDTTLSMSNWDLVPSETINLSAYTEESVHFAWHYQSVPGSDSAWQISNITVTGTPEILAADFIDGNLGTFSTVDLSGENSWEAANFNNERYFAQISGDSSTSPNDDWLISPAMDFQATIMETLEFQTASDGTGPGIKVLISTDYDPANNPAAATWIPIEAVLSPGGWESVESGLIDLTSYVPDFYAEQVHIAWHYTSTSTESAAWEVTNIRISGITKVPVEDGPPEPEGPNTDLSAEYDRDLAATEAMAELDSFNSGWADRTLADEYSISNLIALLDLDYPGLEAVKAAATISDWDATGSALLEYFKNTKNYSDFPAANGSLTDAVNALSHFFKGNKDVHPPIYRGASIDWVSDAYENGEPIADAEWYFQFHRLTWWPALASNYTSSSEERFFLEWRYEMVDFAGDNFPFIKNSTPWFVRRGMETYNRTKQLTTVLPNFIHSDNFDLQTLQYYLYSFHYQAEHIRTIYANDGNHLLGELSEVFRNGIHFPEFKKSGDWIDDALTMLPERMLLNVYPDGMNTELIFSYQGMYVDLFSSAWMLFNEFGYTDSLPDYFYPRLRKMAEIAAYHVFPDFSMVQYGDGWKNRSATWLFREPVSDYAPDLPYLQFMKTSGNLGTPPDKLSAAFPVSGFYTFRSEWARNAIFMPIKNAAGDQWHSQIDNGTFELYAYRRNFMDDSGAYSYNSADPEVQDWREWFRSTKAHQTLTLDYMDIDLVPEHVFWQDSDRLTALVFENQSYTNLNHRRTVLFIDNKYFLIYDQATGTAEGELRAHFNLVPCEYDFDESEFSVETLFTSGANLLVKGFPQDGSMQMREEEGWVSYNFLEKEERPAWSYLVNKKSSDEEVSFLTALVPYANVFTAPDTVLASVDDSASPTIITLMVDGTSYDVSLDIDGGEVDLTITQDDLSEQYSPFFNCIVYKQEDGWKYAGLHGWLHEDVSSDWIYSVDLGWIYFFPPDTRGRYWIYSIELGWTYLDLRYYPLLYVVESGQYIQIGS